MLRFKLNPCIESNAPKAKSYYRLEIACRLWLTIMMGIVFAFWAQNFQSYALIMCVALVLDVIRNISSPEFNKSLEDMKAQYQSEITNTNVRDYNRNWIVYIHYIICILPVVFSILIFFLSYSDYFVNYITYMVDKSWSEFLFPYFGFIENHSSELIYMGYPERVPFMLFVYLVSVFLFIIGMILLIYKTVFVNHIMSVGSLISHVKKSNLQITIFNKVTNPKKSFYICCAIYLLGSFSILYLSVDGSMFGGVKYSIQIHDWPFIVFSVLLSGLLVFGNFAYEFLLRMRMDACGLWLQLNDTDDCSKG